MQRLAAPRRAQAVGDDHDRAPTAEAGERVGEAPLGENIQGGYRLVQDEQLGIFVESARDAEALALAAREADAVLADGLRQARGQAGQPLVELCDGQDRGDSIEVDVSVLQAERHVARDRVVQQEDLLRHEADAAEPA
jgi:hypothetical protein